MNSITLDNWWAQPIHCPFCGQALVPNEEVPCKHLLYIIAYGNFVMRSVRFDSCIGLDQEEFGPEFSRAEVDSIGSPVAVANRVLESLPNGVEFDVTTPSDGALIGFAAYHEELCAYGKDHQSPYDEATQ
jgi:hypothetical protein